MKEARCCEFPKENRSLFLPSAERTYMQSFDLAQTYVSTNLFPISDARAEDEGISANAINADIYIALGRLW